jgi:hypothetical protein
MDKRQTGIIATVATALLCGCPGLLAFCWGSLSAVVSFVPNADINIGGSSDPRSALFAGLGSLCVGILFIAIPVAVGFFMLRQKPTVDAMNTAPTVTDDLPPST